MFIGFAIGAAVFVAAFLTFMSESAVRRVRQRALAKIDALKQELGAVRSRLDLIGDGIAQWVIGLSKQERDDFDRMLQEPNGHQRVALAIADRFLAEREVADIRRVWLGNTNDTRDWENRCVDQLGVAIPYLFPELNPKSSVYRRKSAKTFLSDVYKLTDEDYVRAQSTGPGAWYKLPCNPSMQPDLCGLFELSTSYGVALREPKDVILLVEAKNPSLCVDEWVVEEAFSYAYDLYRLIRSERPIHFECLAVAGEIDPSLQFPSGRLEGFGPATISLQAVTWRDLFERVVRNSGVEKYPRPNLV